VKRGRRAPAGALGTDSYRRSIVPNLYNLFIDANPSHVVCHTVEFFVAKIAGAKIIAPAKKAYSVFNCP